MKKRTPVIIALSFIICAMQIFTGTVEHMSAQTVAINSQAVKTGTLTSKEEVIYSTLTASGEVDEIYAVNILNIVSPGTITDYGSYSDVKNLTSTDEIKFNEDLTSFNAPAGRFYYQGNMIAKALPWIIGIKYYLDNVPIEAEALAGKSGHLKIGITTQKNSNLDPLFYNNYLLQITVTLDTDTCSNISAEGATLANAGTDKLITFTVMPANDGNLSVNTDVKAFGMKGIELSAVPFSMNIELPDTNVLTGGLILLSDAVGKLSSGITSLGEGISQLSRGSDSLKGGSSDFKTGLDEISDQSDALITASAKISESLSAVAGSLSDASLSGSSSSFTKLSANLTMLADGLEGIAGGLTDLDTGFSVAYSALEEAVTTIPDTVIPESSLQKLMMDHPDDITISQLIEAYTAACRIKVTYQAVSPAFAAADANLSTLSDSITTISDSLNLISEQLTSSTEETDITSALTQLSGGISMLSDNYESFHAGLTEYTAGISQLASSYSLLDSGITDLSEGAKEVNTGMGELDKGAKELSEQTSTMPEQVEASINEVLSDYDTSDFAPISFTAKENKVTSVQFIIHTQKIEKAIVQEEIIIDLKHENFWTRLAALFK